MTERWRRRPLRGPRLVAAVAICVLGVAVIGLAAIGLFAGAAGAQQATIARLAGPDRITTAVEVSEAGWASARSAVVAAAHDYPDALVATSLAAALDGPLLLVGGERVPAAVAAELGRLGVAHVLISGGPAAVPESVADDLRERGLTVRRLSGADRWETAAAVGREIGAPDERATLVLGTAFPDAVAAGGVAGTSTGPLLLTLPDRLPAATRSSLRDLGVREVTVIGGPAAVGDEVLAELEELGIGTRRLSGGDRFGTSVAVAVAALDQLPPREVPLVLATGESFPDALTAGALAARRGGTLLLVPAGEAHREVDAFLTEHMDRWGPAEVVGGTAAVSDAQMEHLREVLAARTQWYSIALRGPEGDPVPYDVEVAADPPTRQRGLQGREEVPDGTGMLFLFPSDTHTGFWMKDTLVPLSIAFLHADGTVQEILDMEPCRADPCRTYRPRDPYRMALEVRQGAFDDAGVVAGWVMEAQDDLPPAE